MPTARYGLEVAQSIRFKFGLAVLGNKMYAAGGLHNQNASCCAMASVVEIEIISSDARPLSPD